MKKLFSFILIFVCAGAYAQDPMYISNTDSKKATVVKADTGQDNFSLSAEGFSSQADVKKNYIVLEFPGKSQSELYKQVLLYMNKTYRSPKDVISQLENESITINGFAEKAINRNGMHVFDMNYSMNFQFKDNKVRVAAPSFDLTTYTNKSQRLLLVSGNALDGSVLGIYNEGGKLKSEQAKRGLENFFNAHVGSLVKFINEPAEDW